MKGVAMPEQRGRCSDSGDGGIKPRGVNLGLGFVILLKNYIVFIFNFNF